MRLAAATVLLLLAVGVVDADSTKKAWKRKLKVKMDRNEVEIEAETEIEEGKVELEDKIEFEIKGDDEGLEINMEYKYKNYNKNSTDSSTGNEVRNKYEIKYKFVVQSIIEFVPTDIAKGFQEGTDDVLQEIKLTEWSSMVRGSIDVSGVEVDTFTIKATAGEKGPIVFTSKGAISTQTLNDMDYSSNYVKFDFGINNFPYKGDKTALALKTKIKGKFKQKTKSSDKRGESVRFRNEGVEMPSKAPFGRFSWVRTAQADNANIDIISSTKDDKVDGSTKYFFAFDTLAQPVSVMWDPEVGVGYDDNADNVSSVSSTVTVASFAALASFLAHMML